MQHFVRFVSFLVMALVLSGCGASYYHKYSYTPPAAPGSERCIAQCWQGRNACEQICSLKNPQCAAEARVDAETRYNDYVHQRQAKGLPVSKSLKDFQRTAQCFHSCNCIPAFNTCYSACGGYVT